jgi:hypothetical protein
MERVAATLDSAARNFHHLLAGDPASGALLLAESAREHVFDRLRDQGQIGSWQISPVPDEPQSIVARSGDRAITIVCGRQLRCELGLEVLALGTTARYPEGRSLDETIERVRADGALAVVPWGFGKWMGRAGQAIRELFRRRGPGTVFAGDNGGRLNMLGQPGLLGEARLAGIRILPGTDPFPFGQDYRRVGAFGFLADIELAPEAPWKTLRQWLADDASQPRPYGSALGPLKFVFNQGWIQVHNRMLSRSAA